MAASKTVREAFHGSVRLFVETTERVAADQWDRPALGEWSVRDLVGHTSRAIRLVEVYLAKSASRVDLTDGADYFFAALSDVTDDAAVAERGRQAGVELGPEPARAVRALADRLLPLVDQTADDALVGTPWGGIRLLDYLVTRVFELSIHTMDLAAALGIAIELPEECSVVTWELVTQLARRGGTEKETLFALTGRSSLPADYTVLKPPSL